MAYKIGKYVNREYLLSGANTHDPYLFGLDFSMW